MTTATKKPKTSTVQLSHDVILLNQQKLRYWVRLSVFPPSVLLYCGSADLKYYNARKSSFRL